MKGEYFNRYFDLSKILSLSIEGDTVSIWFEMLDSPIRIHKMDWEGSYYDKHGSFPFEDKYNDMVGEVEHHLTSEQKEEQLDKARKYYDDQVTLLFNQEYHRMVNHWSSILNVT